MFVVNKVVRHIPLPPFPPLHSLGKINAIVYMSEAHALSNFDAGSACDVREQG